MFIGVFLSFFVEDLRVQNLNDHRKNKYLKDLRLTLDIYIEAIQLVNKEINMSSQA